MMKIAFTSCSNAHQQLRNQPVWGIIHGQKPDLLLLLGDNVYLGNEAGFDKVILNAKYEDQLEEPHFKKLIDEVPFLATWDNHDFGIPASVFGSTVMEPHRSEARELFDKHLKRRSLEPDTEFVYCTHIIGHVKFIMLDVRSWQEPPGFNTTTLGTVQENWLLAELAKNEARFHIICSGTTFSMSERSWTSYNIWAHKFTRAMATVSKPLFLAGNMHANGFARHRTNKIALSPPFLKFNRFFEVISSSVGRNGDDGLPDNKYGLITINEPGRYVDIALYSQRPGNNIHKIIDIPRWKVRDSYPPFQRPDTVRETFE